MDNRPPNPLPAPTMTIFVMDVSHLSESSGAGTKLTVHFASHLVPPFFVRIPQCAGLLDIVANDVLFLHRVGGEMKQFGADRLGLQSVRMWIDQGPVFRSNGQPAIGAS